MPQCSQVPRRRAVDGYISNQDSRRPIITNNTPRNWSLITGKGLENGKIVGPKHYYQNKMLELRYRFMRNDAEKYCLVSPVSFDSMAI